VKIALDVSYLRALGVVEVLAGRVEVAGLVADVGHGDADDDELIQGLAHSKDQLRGR
jgi:hypothetical protein